MPAKAQLNAILRKLGWMEKIFIVVLVLDLALILTAPQSGWTALAQVLAFCFGVAVAVKITVRLTRRAIWRLRNRIIVTYLFIGGIPILLIAALVGLSGYLLTSQMAVFFVTSELDRRVDLLRYAAKRVAATEASSRAEAARQQADLGLKDKFSGLTVLVRTAGVVSKYPPNSPLAPPPSAAASSSGVVYVNGDYFVWAHEPLAHGDVTVLAPMGPDELSALVPNLGVAQFVITRRSGQGLTISRGGIDAERKRRATTAKVPPARFRGDIPISFGAIVPVAVYEKPLETEPRLLGVTSRLSAVYDVLFSRWANGEQAIPIALAIISIAFLIVEIVALVVGITMTRTITGAVHRLYEGTQSVMQGDFSHRISIKGRDQLSDLGKSFNLMTERIENLLAVAKEKERLQSEIEIAREVQSQLYPKKVPDVRTLKLTAICKPARMVSGDYFDYECIRGNKVALAIGDVAGKGISAALLMATLQSSLRTELRNTAEFALAAGNGSTIKPVTTSSLVVHLNEQLHAYTSPEKYATFYLGIYDEDSALLRYTNAGHLPPILVREGEATRLNVDGTVVGAFPFAQYDESQLAMQSGDLLVCFTDGVSEPENEYGEMFGEDRLVDLVVRNAHKSDAQIVEAIIEAVEQWTSSPELQDDLTLLLARRQ